MSNQCAQHIFLCLSKWNTFSSPKGKLVHSTQCCLTALVVSSCSLMSRPMFGGFSRANQFQWRTLWRRSYCPAWNRGSSLVPLTLHLASHTVSTKIQFSVSFFFFFSNLFFILKFLLDSSLKTLLRILKLWFCDINWWFWWVWVCVSVLSIGCLFFLILVTCNSLGDIQLMFFLRFSLILNLDLLG